ncbi:MAG TPA: PEP-CTERM sorting domain-containing protein [Pirellulales bacterium]|jgi:hypothetical protein
MKSLAPWKALALALIAATIGVSAEMSKAADITNFLSGNLVIMRGGDATSSQSTFSSGEVPAYLDEYNVTVSGGIATPVFIGSFTIPTATLTLPGSAQNSHEGRLELSGDGRFLDFAGYQQPISAATTRRTDSLGTGSYYQIGQVSVNAVFTNSALNTAVAQPQFVRGAFSQDGAEAWVASKNPSGGLEYVSGFGDGSPATVQLQATTDWRDIKINSNQLYGGTGSSSVGTHGFYAIGGTTPPTSGTPGNTLLTGVTDTSTSGFSFATLPVTAGSQPINGVAGTPNTVYILGDPSGNQYIAKGFSAGGTALGTGNLTLASRITLNTDQFDNSIPAKPIGILSPEAIVAKIDPDNSSWVDLFVQNANGVYFSIDKSGTNGGDFGALTFHQIINATGDTSFYGLAPAPVPEPSTFVLAGIGIAGLAGTWLKRRRSL